MSVEREVLIKNSVIRQLNDQTGAPRCTVTSMKPDVNGYVASKALPEYEEQPWDFVPDPGRKKTGSRRLIIMNLYITGAAFLVFFLLVKARVVKL